MKLTFEEAMDRLGDDRIVDRDDVLAWALKRSVWVAEWHIPGCMSESRSYCATKGDAIDAALSMSEGPSGYPRGMRTALRRDGAAESMSPLFGRVINTVQKHKLVDLLL